MKKYKVEYWFQDRPHPSCLIEFSKIGIRDGIIISFWNNGIKYWQANWKNDLLNGFDRNWQVSEKTKNDFLQNWKKDKIQGIIIKFE